MEWRGVSHQKTEQTKTRDVQDGGTLAEASSRGALWLDLNLLRSEARTLDCVLGVNTNADTYNLCAY